MSLPRVSLSGVSLSGSSVGAVGSGVGRLIMCTYATVPPPVQPGRYPVHIDQTSLYADRVRPLLDPEERLLAAAYARIALGDESGLKQPAGGTERWITGVDIFGLHWNPARIDRLLAGRVGTGGPDGLAAQLARALSFEDDLGARYLAVTDCRLMVLGRRETRADAPLHLRHAVPRTEVIQARRRSRYLALPQVGRVVLEFADGSSLAVVTGFFLTIAARKLAHALTDRGTP